LRKKHENLKYIWVLERTENGRIHIHLLSSLEFKDCISKSNELKTEKHKIHEQQLEKVWSYKRNNLGWVDIRSINKDDCRKCSLYLASYLNKAMYETKIEKEKHLYGYSKRTLKKPIEQKFETIQDIESILKDFTKEYELTYSSSYKLKINNDDITTITYMDLYKK